MLTFFLVVAFMASMLTLGIHEEWLEAAGAFRWLGWSLLALGAASGLALIVLLT